MASIQSAVGGLANSIFAATALGSHLYASSPGFKAGQAEKEASKIETVANVLPEGETKEGLVKEAQSRRIEAAKISPTAERLSDLMQQFGSASQQQEVLTKMDKQTTSYLDELEKQRKTFNLRKENN